MLNIEGTEVCEEKLYGCQVSTVHICSEQAAKQLKNPIGSYITIYAGSTFDQCTEIEDIGECLVEVLNRVLRPYYHGKLCICGIGNKNVLADTLGPEVTYNLPLKIYSEMNIEGNFREVCSIDPGTSLTTNINTEIIVKGVVKEIEADCVLLVDSLAANDPERLFQTIQISTAGGLRSYLSDRRGDWSSLGVPVISIGVPLAISLSTLVPNQFSNKSMLTSTKAQEVIATVGRIIAYAILRVCWPKQSKVECFFLSGINGSTIPFNFPQNKDDETNYKGGQEGI